ncbi:dual specificity protein phosphatase family protein [Candidatus Moduliflexota bacterium]
MNSKKGRPIEDSYWVVPELFLAGEYPGAPRGREGRLKVASLLDAGIRQFIDLTMEGEYDLRPYVPDLAEVAQQRGLEVLHRRMPIKDLGTPSNDEMANILNEIDASISDERPVYVHCFGGIGRTGTVVGCYLVRSGLSGEQALDLIDEWRSGTPDGDRASPEMPEQKQMVLDWGEGG